MDSIYGRAATFIHLAPDTAAVRASVSGRLLSLCSLSMQLNRPLKPPPPASIAENVYVIGWSDCNVVMQSCTQHFDMPCVCGSVYHILSPPRETSRAIPPLLGLYASARIPLEIFAFAVSGCPIISVHCCFASCKHILTAKNGFVTATTDNKFCSDYRVILSLFARSARSKCDLVSGITQWLQNDFVCVSFPQFGYFFSSDSLSALRCLIAVITHCSFNGGFSPFYIRVSTQIADELRDFNDIPQLYDVKMFINGGARAPSAPGP